MTVTAERATCRTLAEYVAYFVYNSEPIFWTEGYSSKANARNAIESIRKNGPGAEIVDTTAD